jgi:hypothetical protein
MLALVERVRAHREHVRACRERVRACGRVVRAGGKTQTMAGSPRPPPMCQRAKIPVRAHGYPSAPANTGSRLHRTSIKGGVVAV